MMVRSHACRPLRAASVLTVLFVLGAASATAQLSAGDLWEQAGDADVSNPTRMTAFTGVTNIRDETRNTNSTFWRIDLRPDLNFGRLRVGLKAVLLIGDPEGGEDGIEVLTEDGEEWDSLGAYLRAVRYVQWATPRAPFYARYGELFDVRIGNGLLMEGYANLDRRGLRINANQHGWGVEGLLNNLDQPELFGGRLYVLPFELAAAGAPILSKVAVGFAYLVDVDPVPDLSDVTLNAYAVDATLPLIDRELLSIRLYDELAFLSYPEISTDVDRETVKGNAVGIGLDLPRLHAKLEYRTFDEGFEPTLFGYDYEYRARTPVRGPSDTEATKGYYGAAALDLGSQISVSGTFENYDGDGPVGDPRLSLRAIETGLIEPVDVAFYYTKRGIQSSDEESFLVDLVDLDERSLFVVQIAYKVSGPLRVVATREYRFRERPDGEGFEPIKKTTFQLGLAF